MIQLILVIITASILLFLSSLHFYWVFGGKWGIASAIPEQWKKDFFDPKNKIKNNIATLVVAIGLLFLALITSSNSFAISDLINSKFAAIGSRIIGILFLLRAVGDFNTVGIFKKKANTSFNKSDTKIFIPLCLFIGVCSLVISFL